MIEYIHEEHIMDNEKIKTLTKDIPSLILEDRIVSATRKFFNVNTLTKPHLSKDEHTIYHTLMHYFRETRIQYFRGMRGISFLRGNNSDGQGCPE